MSNADFSFGVGLPPRVESPMVMPDVATSNRRLVPVARPIRAQARRIVLPRDDAARATAKASFSARAARSSHAQIFARIAAERIDASGVLRYDDRVKLIRAAGRLGISRFDANLLIAAEQNRAGQGRDEVTAQPRETSPDPLTSRVLHTCACAVFVQGIIMAGAWWTFIA